MKFPVLEEEKQKWSSFLEKLHTFDEQIAPVGLYGIRDYKSLGAEHPPFEIEWELLIKPAMRELGCNPARNPPMRRKLGVFQFQPTSPVGEVRVLRMSKIKVRKYGSSYRVDPHHDFGVRWKEAAVDSVLHRLWKLRGRQSSLLLLIGFADEANPFEKEIEELQNTQTFRERLHPAFLKTWDDPHERGFRTVGAIWIIPRRQKL